MGSPTAWLLNFEADQEFASAGPFTPSGSLAEQLVRLRHANAHRLLEPGDVHIGPGCEGMFAQAWCPTPSALARIREARAQVPAAPSFDILRRVNSREFCTELPRDFDDGFFACNPSELLRGLDRQAPRNGWLFKRNFSTSGRGQLRFAGREWNADVRHWVQHAWHSGGLRVEPLRQIDTEFSIHGWLAVSGELTIGEACVQSTDARGSWVETRRALRGELKSGEQTELLASARSCGASLRDAGYFGPFGVDAYRWLDAAGAAHLESRSEINARYTLGWKAGFGERNPARA